MQSFESVWWVCHAGFFDVVALMADTPSPEQSKAIVGMVRKTGRVSLLPDDNKAGERCAAELFFDVGPAPILHLAPIDRRNAGEL